MNGANKILTVSYGTFSCTLEGFDDPFNTMKAIAEYFRDLAAEDRYFGAEPPTPDAAMLHRIAEREVQRRVEARVQDNGVILRAAEEPAAAPVAAPAIAREAVAAPVTEAPVEAPVAEAVAAEPEAPAPETAEAPVVEDIAEVEAAEEAAPEPEAEAAPEAPTVSEEAAPAEDFPAMDETVAEEPPEEDLAPKPSLADAMPEGVVARLARLRQAVSVAGGEPVAPAMTTAAAMPEHFEDEHAGAIGSMAGLAGAFADADDHGDYLPENLYLQEDPDEAAEPVVLAEEAVADAGDFEGDADVLERLLADEEDVLTPIEEEAAAEPADAEPVEAAPVAEAEDDLAGLIASLSGGEEAGSAGIASIAVAVEIVEASEQESEAVDPFAGDIGLADEELFEPADAPEVTASGAMDDDLPDALSEDRNEGTATEEPAAEPVAEEIAEEIGEKVEAGFAAAPTEAGTVSPDEAPGARPADAASFALPEVSDEVADKLRRARARVINIRRADGLPSGEEEESFPETADDQPQTGGASHDDDMARLLRQADDEMSEPENRRRLSAIQHLKAAVAATVAERRAGMKEPSDEDRADPYRADLARVVRPVRPRAAEGGPVRPTRPVRPAREPAAGLAAAGDRPAPLVLVSEQRIDRMVTTVRVTPVRPQRVGGGAAAAAPVENDARLEAELQATMRGEDRHPPADEADLAADTALVAAFADEAGEDAEEAGNIFDDSRGFAEFAERLGAADLSQMLEAAAAYATCVEKREHFTRPFLMKQVEAGRLVEGFTREDGLRGFGTLLREGRIAKVGRGHFMLAGNSSYLAEARKLAR